jgi:two-component system sensor histidine kinase HydH
MNRGLARISRAALVAAIAVVGAGLLIVVWSMNRAVHSASESTIRGEMSAAFSTVRARLVDVPDDQRAAKLAEAIAAQPANGLVYIAELDQEGHITAEAGTPSAASPAELAAWVATATSGVPRELDGRARVAYKRPQRPGEPPPRITVLELVPRAAAELRDTARLLLLLGGVAALTLVALSALLVRWSLRREQAVRAAEQARHLATLGQMSAVLAHEIRNPLASLKGNAQLLAGSLPDGEKSRAKADRVVGEATRLEHLTNDLLDFARGGELRFAEVDPVAMLREAADAVAPDRIDVIVSDAPRAWSLDAGRVRQVAVNLLENAVEMSEGKVDARLSRDGGALVLEIRDRGPGIADADLPHVFEPFFTRRTRGTGLGLAVCRRIVELHGGTIAASNASDGGAVFRVSLPK